MFNICLLFVNNFFCHFIIVLVLNGASPAGSVAIQLAMMGGVKVLTTAASTEELLYLQSFQPSIGMYQYLLILHVFFSRHNKLNFSMTGHIIDMTTRSSALRASCLEETAGHGVDLILDLGCSQYPVVSFIFSTNKN
jgi:NADPH:quinone reductase-like Zn-dependent oxidoreductase